MTAGDEQTTRNNLRRFADEHDNECARAYGSRFSVSTQS